jgi:hypothetical protein
VPLGPLGTPLVVLLLTLLVPVAFRYGWPARIGRPALFLAITLTLALVVAGCALSWYLQPLAGMGVAGSSAGGTDNGNVLFEAQMRTRFFTAAIFAVLAQYWLCRGTQFLLGR